MEGGYPATLAQRGAKADRGAPPGQEITAWLPLSQHLADAAGIAERLVDEWVSPHVVRRIASDIGGGHNDVRILATWLAAVHDVGKVSPAFAVQAPPLADAMREHGLDADPRISLDPARSRVRHEIVGQVAVRAFLTDVLGYPPRGAAAQLAVIVGGHHGIPPSASTAKLPADHPVLSGDASWSLCEPYDLYMTASLRRQPDDSGVREVPATEARNRMAELIDAVMDGEFVYLTRRGKRVAALMPADVAEHYEQIEDDYWARKADEAHERLRENPGAAVPWDQVITELERADG